MFNSIILIIFVIINIDIFLICTEQQIISAYYKYIVVQPNAYNPVNAMQALSFM